MSIITTVEPGADGVPALDSPPPLGQAVKAYINLIKPHVTVLLVAVTALTMVMAAHGMPPPVLLLATLLGGLLATGSANAINC